MAPPLRRSKHVPGLWHVWWPKIGLPVNKRDLLTDFTEFTSAFRRTGSVSRLLEVLPACVTSMGDFWVQLSAQLTAVRQFPGIDIKIEEPRKGCETSETDRFTIVIPCCYERLRWTVIFNADLPDLPPDIIFTPHDTFFHPLLPSQEGSADLQELFRGWRLTDSQLLLRLLLKLRSLHVRSQVLLLEKIADSRVHFEVTSLGKRETEEIQLSVPLLGLDFSSLGEMIASHGAIEVDVLALQHPNLHLLLAFPVAPGGGGKSSPAQGLRLVGSPTVHAALALLEVQLPLYTDRTYLTDYVEQLELQLQNQVLEMGVAVEKRKEFIAALVPLLGRPLEMDTVLFRRTSLFLTARKDLVMVHISLSANFPGQQPILMFQSSQHFESTGRPIVSRPLEGCPWSPRWDSQEMVSRLW